MTIILFSRMMTTQTRMNHPKIAYHPGFIDKPGAKATHLDAERKRNQRSRFKI